MMIRLLFGFLLLVFVTTAHAQTGYIRIPSCGGATPPQGSSQGYQDANGNICTSATGGGGGTVTQGPPNAGGAAAWPTSITPTTGTPTEITVTCGTSATALLAASTATTFVAVQNPNGVANTVWVNYAGASAVAAPPSFSIVAGVTQVWSTVNGYVPTSGLSCISSPGAQPVTLSYK